ncbi:oligosaccharide flippase family protein [Falsigemmobacter faecalis]|uniref:Uncharacterized protein n=1 Tax=Falsigemmobacter faecalis TaxID=2488730 RepID=A0A3P3DVW5_9RHOB|nr:oligosaccharide flippase family protein [Falsigemmobacter faecalis]RRH78271.1 hypothetical protein EG244_02170 [Falsigemmobacter faecalis]
MRRGGIARSAGLMAAVQLVSKCLDFGAILILARLLTPEDFGLVALAAGVMVIVGSLTEVPVTEALIQRGALSPGEVSAAFTLTLLRGLLIALLLLGMAAPLAGLFDEPRLAAILNTLALAPLIQGCASPAMIHALRALNYAALARSHLYGKLAAFVAMLAVAAAGGGYWALVAGLVTGPVIASLSTHVLAPWSLRLSLTGVRGIFRFAGWVTLSRMIFTLNQQIDRFVVGAILGRPQLGLYAMAGDLASLATYTLAAPVSQPLFAGFAALQAEPLRLRDTYLLGQQILLAVIAPAGFLFAALAGDLVPLVLGAGWGAMVPIIWWLAPVIALQVLTLPGQALLMALGRTRVLAAREGLSLLLRLPVTLFAALAFGLVEAAAARALAALVMIAVMLSLAGGAIGISATQQIRHCARIFPALALMVAGVALAGQALPVPEQAPGGVLRLGLLCAIGALIYAGSLLSLWRLAGRPEGAERWILARLSAAHPPGAADESGSR